MADVQEKYLAYKGVLLAVAARGSRVFFITRHAEKRLTPLYTLELDNFKLSETPLPALMTVLCLDGEALWLGSETGQLFQCDQLLLQLAATTPIRAICVLAGQRLALLQEEKLLLVDSQSGKLLQQFELLDKAGVMAVDGSGQWLVLGNSKGQVQVYECETQPELVFSAAEQLHEGAVTALSFMPDEPRFLSAGSDNRLLSTHARGKLEPEDRGHGAMHDKPVTAILQAQGERFITGARDQSCKSWLRNGRIRPATFEDNTGVVHGLALAKLHERPYLVVASEDRMRLITLDAEGKFGKLSHRFFDVYEWLADELKQYDSKRRQLAIEQLAALDDAAAIKMLLNQARNDGDFNLRKLATDKLGQASHAQAVSSLENLLSHNDAAVRIAAFEYLLQWPEQSAQARPVDWVLRLVEPAFKTTQQDLGCMAVSALEQWATKDDRAMTRLLQAINAKPYTVRCFALLSLEQVHQDANLLALSSNEADLRAATLTRMLQRNMLEQSRVQAALRRRLDDGAESVRQTALLVSLATRPELVKALRGKDASLHKQLFELETMNFSESEAKAAELPKASKAKVKLEAADFQPLLQASAASALDVSVQAAYWLALLEDSRAFGLLLQLSRAADVAARVKVCQALAVLADERARQRLQTMLNDEAVSVRDATYSALLAVYPQQNLAAVELGFASGHLDVRQRALHTLVKHFKESYAQHSVSDNCWHYLRWALNDGQAALRNEAFKAVLNTMQEQDYQGALRFVLHSNHADIRNEVLTQLTAEAGAAWAWSFLLELLNDPDQNIREQTLSFALKKTKGRDLQPLELALQSRYPSTRMQAINELVNKAGAPAQALLLSALSDEDFEVRQQVLKSLVSGNSSEGLLQALQSPYPDVVLQAAAACARMGEGAALPVLMAIVQRPRPELDRDVASWQSDTVKALNSLAELADAACLPAVQHLLDSSVAEIQAAAVNVLVWCGGDAYNDWLRQALRMQVAPGKATITHQPAWGGGTIQITNPAEPSPFESVKQAAALALAWQGDKTALQQLLDKPKDSKLALIAALAKMGDDYLQHLANLLDDNERSVRRAALLVLLLQEYVNPADMPARLFAILSAKQAAYRLLAAEFITAFAQRDDMAEQLVRLFNQQRGDRQWQIARSDVELFARVVVCGSPQLCCRALQLLNLLDEEKQQPWDGRWLALQQRYASQLAALPDLNKKLSKSALSQPELNQVAFGTYCGLVREPMPGKPQRYGLSDDQQEVLAVRQYAISGLAKLCQQQAELQLAAQPVLMQALGDTQQPVRLLALEKLQALAVDNALLAAECLETGHNDLGVKALQMLIASGSEAQGQVILRDAMSTRNDELALEAATLLRKTLPVAEVAEAALQARHEQLRIQALSWLTEVYPEPAAQQLLYAALESRYRSVRENAAYSLALKHDAKALPALATMLADASQQRDQLQYAAWMEMIGGATCADLLLQRIEHDPANNAAFNQILGSVGNLRQTSVAPRLLTMLQDKRWRSSAFVALVKLSGFDQSYDKDDDKPDRSWMEKQLPRDDGLLLQLALRCLELGEVEQLQLLVPLLRWSLSNAADEVLATLCKHSQDELRRKAVAALGWRIYKRQAKPQPVLDALAHQDPLTQFHAAYQLAHAGKPQGISVLLSAVQTLDDLDCRRMAVTALGILADPRALDTLLTLAADDNHALQEPAAEAIGHLGKTEQAEQIFTLLQRFVKSERPVLVVNALKGLRYFDSREGWALVREAAASEMAYIKNTALEMLGYHPDQASRDLLLDILSHDPSWRRPALASARRLFAADDLAPDYACLSGGQELLAHDEEFKRCLQRVMQHGSAEAIFGIYAQCASGIRSLLARCLLDKSPLPISEALTALAQAQASVVELAATVLGYASEQLPKNAASQIEQVLANWLAQWQQALQQQQKYQLAIDPSLVQVVCRLIWLAGQHKLAEASLLQLVQLPHHIDHQTLRRAALSALDSNSKTVQHWLNTAVLDQDVHVRQQASLAAKPAPLEPSQLEKTLWDRQVYLTLAGNDHSLEAKAVSNRHQMGIVLNRLVAQQAVETLLNTARDTTLDELVRLNAIQGLGQIATESGEQALNSLGNQSDLDEDLKKMAWRCLKRARRGREKGVGADGCR